MLFISSALKTNMLTMDTRTTVILIIAVCCAVLPLEITHLLSALVGAAAYLLVQALQGASVDPRRPAPRESKSAKAPKAWQPASGREWPQRSPERPTRSRDSDFFRHMPDGPRVGVRIAPKPEVRKPSAVPVLAPTFQSAGWEAEVEELVAQLASTPESDEVVKTIAETVKSAIARVIPEAEVSGFTSGSLMSGKAFGVAVPEVDIVVNASPQALLGRLQGRWSAGPRSAKLDARKLQKSAIRACTDQLVSTGTFKFRRSAFRGDEPKVTMIAPSSMSGCEQGVPINLSVNTVTPVYNAALVAECSDMEPRTKELVLLVKRWAKDRGLCHTAKGHLPPYAWTLLTIFYLQVSASEDGEALLPALEGSRALMGTTDKGATMQPQKKPDNLATGNPYQTIGDLFRGFIHFYAKEYNWRDEAVSVRTGKRGGPNIKLPLHIVLHDDGKTTTVGPSIENPFEAAGNLGCCTSVASLRHLHEELKRAETLCTQGGSLTELLTPWAPAEVDGEGEEEA